MAEAPPIYAHIRVMSRLDRKPVYCPPRSNTSASAPTISSTAPSAAKGSSASFMARLIAGASSPSSSGEEADIDRIRSARRSTVIVAAARP